MYHSVLQRPESNQLSFIVKAAIDMSLIHFIGFL